MLLASDSNSAASTGASDDYRSRRFDLFGSLGYEVLDRTASDFEDGYDSSIGRATFGLDYRFTDWFVAGLIFTYSQHDGDFDDGGDFENSSLLPTVFASFLPSEKSFVLVSLGLNLQEYDVQREASFVVADPLDPNVILDAANGTPISTTDADVDLASLQFGYDFSAGNFTYGPRVSGYYSRTTVDSYTEDDGAGLELNVDEQTVKSVQGAVAFFGSWALSSKSGVFLPQFTVEYVREFEDEPTIVDAQFAQDLRGPQAVSFSYETNTPDSDFVNLDVGFSAVLANGILPYVNLRAMFGNDLFDSYSANAGVRFEL